MNVITTRDLRMPASGIPQVTLSEAQHLAMNEGRYEFRRVLGSGAFGCVFLARDNWNLKDMAIKICCTGRAGLTQEGIEPHLKEARTLKRMESNEVIAVEEVYLFNAGFPKHIAVAIVTEYCSRGNLNDYLVQNATTVTEQDQMKFMRQVAFGLLAIHEKGFTHRDIKPENILLTERLNVKIADLGTAKAAWDMSSYLQLGGHSLSGYMTTEAGTPAFSAPEILSDRPLLYTNAVDIFSAGLVFVCITCPEKFILDYGMTVGGSSRKVMPLFNGHPYGSVCFGTVARPTGILDIRRSLDPEMADLIDKMLDEKASERPVIKDVLSALLQIPSPSMPRPASRPAGSIINQSRPAQIQWGATPAMAWQVQEPGAQPCVYQ